MLVQAGSAESLIVYDESVINKGSRHIATGSFIVEV